jgi:hypothetical protein
LRENDAIGSAISLELRLTAGDVLAVGGEVNLALIREGINHILKSKYGGRYPDRLIL